MRYNILSCLLLIVLCTGCKKFVQIGPPNTEVVTASVFNSNGNVTSALLGIYISMFNNAESWSMAQNQGLLSDELTNYSTNLPNIQFYTNSMLALDNNGNWNNAYNYIYQANALIAGLKNNSNIGPPIVQQITGESLFIRAFWHFYLTNMYGAIPVVTTTEYTMNASISRTPRPQVYTQIIQDLQDAQSLLNPYYVDATDTAQSTERVRPTKAAAEAMLARVYLYTNKFDSAEAEATMVINNSNLYSLDSNLSLLMGPNSVFLMNSTEAIWQLYTPQPASENTVDAQNFILTSAPNTRSGNSATISPELLNAFEPGDLRKTNWIGVYSTTDSPAINYYFPYKYQAFNVSTPTEYTMVLRLAEQYLIRAEARAQQNNPTGAVQDLNTIRLRAGLGAYSGGMDETSILAAILHERQVELFSEWGHRWFDLNRTGAADSVMGTPGQNICNLKGGEWKSDWQLYPIPQTEISTDNHLTQNPGY